MMEEADTREQLREIKDKLTQLESKIDTIVELLDGSLKTSCEKMGEHIDFVERVYDNVKNPLGYICNKVSYLSGTGQHSLEAPESVSPDSGIIDEDSYNSL